MSASALEVLAAEGGNRWMSHLTSKGVSDPGLQLAPRVPVDLNLPPEVNQELQQAREPSNPPSEPVRVDKVLREKEEFVRNAVLSLQDDVYPATNKVGHALSIFKDKFCKRCAPFRIFRQGTPTCLCESILKTQGSRRAGLSGERNGLKLCKLCTKGKVIMVELIRRAPRWQTAIGSHS
jgi:hypothetical protein